MPSVSYIPPPVSSQSRPDLGQINEYNFQDLTVQLLLREGELINARLHGPRGTKQFGVDATAKIVKGGKLVLKKTSLSNLRNATSIRTASEHSSRLGEAIGS